MNDKPRKIALGRIVALCITLVLLALAIPMTVTTAQISGRFAQWQKDRPVDIAVDLSKTGTTTAPFIQTCQSAHSESIFLEVEGLDLKKTSDALNGLAGSIRIVYDDQSADETFDLAEAIPIDMGPDNKARLGGFFPFPTGTYTLILKVDKPAPLLANHAQRLTAQYMLCGMEQWPELFGYALSALLWILVLLFGAPSTFGLLKYGWRKR
jgi:hypothetical protein